MRVHDLYVVRWIPRRRQVHHITRVQRRQIKLRCASRGRVAPENHQLVRIHVPERSWPHLHRMRRPPRRRNSRIRTVNPRNVPLRQFVRSRGIRPHRNRRIVKPNFRNQALMRRSCHRLLNRLQRRWIHRPERSPRPIPISPRRRRRQKPLLRLVDVQPASKERIHFHAWIYCDRVRIRRVLRLILHVRRAKDVVPRRCEKRNRHIFGVPVLIVLHAQQRHRHPIRQIIRLKPVRRGRIEITVRRLRLEQPKKYAHLLRLRSWRFSE